MTITITKQRFVGGVSVMNSVDFETMDELRAYISPSDLREILGMNPQRGFPTGEEYPPQFFEAPPDYKRWPNGRAANYKTWRAELPLTAEDHQYAIVLVMADIPDDPGGMRLVEIETIDGRSIKYPVHSSENDEFLRIPISRNIDEVEKAEINRLTWKLEECEKIANERGRVIDDQTKVIAQQKDYINELEKARQSLFDSAQRNMFELRDVLKECVTIGSFDGKWEERVKRAKAAIEATTQPWAAPDFSDDKLRPSQLDALMDALKLCREIDNDEWWSGRGDGKGLNLMRERTAKIVKAFDDGEPNLSKISPAEMVDRLKAKKRDEAMADAIKVCRKIVEKVDENQVTPRPYVMADIALMRKIVDEYDGK